MSTPAALSAPGPYRRDETPLVHTARIYAEFVRVGFVNTLAYRLRYYTGTVTYLI
jgi:hypothetical protein